MQGFAFPVCVSGTHGKTTTSSMVAEILIAAKKDPTVHVGGVLPSIGAGHRAGGRAFFVLEADEYRDSFLQFRPYAAAVLNMDADHPDYFADAAHYRRSFRSFAENIDPNGVLVISENIAGLDAFTEGLACRVATFGISQNAAVRADIIAYAPAGRAAFDLVHHNAKLCRISLRLRGEHNVMNALAAAGLALAVGVTPGDIRAGLENFDAPLRRFEIKGERDGVTVVDDYAHHPREIEAMLASARRVPHRSIWCVFQPHTYSRTKAFLDAFAEALAGADQIVLVDIFAAREPDTGEVSSADLAERLVRMGKDAVYAPSFGDAEKILFGRCIHGDLLITVGAGEGHLIGESFLRGPSRAGYPQNPQQ